MNIRLFCDLVFMVGGFVLLVSLSFSVARRVKMPAMTSLPTAIVLTLFAACFALMELYLAVASTALTAVCWYAIYFKRKGGTI